MTEATPAEGPVRSRERIQSLDLIRGVALFGILLMNITLFGLPMAYSDPTVYGGATGANLWAWIITTVGFEGTQRATFSILFGAGLILLTSRLDSAGRVDAADIFHRRALWLVVFGVIHAYLILWIGEILYFYGLTALFMYPLRKLSSRALLSMAAAGLVLGALWNALDSYTATQKWEKATAAPKRCSTAAASSPRSNKATSTRGRTSPAKPNPNSGGPSMRASRPTEAPISTFSSFRRRWPRISNTGTSTAISSTSSR